ncbi:hypothetical protein AWN76_005520 [Rhodothermaceae bacterium RA]|nr:hypothetical protein AWN76_005520 [Rhodothermaceae bacterium RA]
MVRNAGDGDVGFLIPRLAAAHYVNLHRLSVQQERLIREQRLALAGRDSLIEVHRLRIAELEGIIDARGRQLSTLESDLRLTRQTLDEASDRLRRERRRKKFWRTTTLLSGASASVLAIVLALAV